MAFINKLDEELVGKGLTKQISNVLSKGVLKRYSTMAEFTADGGASVFGEGILSIANQLYYSNASTISPIGSSVTDALGNMVTTYKSRYLGFSPGDTDLSTKLQTFLNTVGANVVVEFEPGDYTFTAPITINQNGVHLIGKGEYATRFTYSPVADGVFLTFSKSTSVSYNCSIKNLSITTANTTNSKTAIAAMDVSGFTADHILINNFLGKDSHGIRVYGRENSTFENLRINNTDICLRFSPNPNTLEWLSVDHMVVRDTYLTPSSTATSGGTIPTTSILIDDKTMISGFTMEGRNAWVSGERGFYCKDTTGTMASYELEIANVRREQPTSTTYSAIHIERTSANGRLQNVIIKNFYQGVGQSGILLKGIDNILLENNFVTDQTYNSIEVDNCVSMEWINQSFSSTNSSKFVMPNMEMIKGVQRIDSNVYPKTASFNKKPVAIYQQRPYKGMNGTNLWEYSGDLTDSTTLQLPFNTTNGYKLAIVDVSILALDGTISETGTFSIAAIDGVAQTGQITASTSSSNVTITTGTFPTTLVNKYLFIGEVSAGLVTAVAGDGLSLTLSSNSTVAATNSTNWHGISVNDTVRGVKKITGTNNITNINTASKFMIWCNGATPMLNNVYFYNRLGKTVSIIARAIFI